MINPILLYKAAHTFTVTQIICLWVSPCLMVWFWQYWPIIWQQLLTPKIGVPSFSSLCFINCVRDTQEHNMLYHWCSFS